MWPSQRGIPKRSRGRHLCWRCRSATLARRTVRDKEPGLPETALPSGEGLSLSPGPAPLRSCQQRPWYGVPLLPQTPGKMRGTVTKCTNSRRETSGGRGHCPLCSWHSSPPKFLRGPSGSSHFFAQLNVPVSPLC